MRILQLEPANVGNQGDHSYRTAQPLRALCDTDGGVRAVSGTWLSPAMREAAEVADVVILCKVADPDLLALVARRRASGRPTVYEINDDFTAVQPWNATAGFFAQPENRSLVMQLAQGCEGLQFSSHGLLDKFGALHAAPVLWPNQLAQVPALPPVSTTAPPSRPITIGWGGSYGHRDDLAAAIPALRTVLDARDNVRLAIMGDPRLRPLFADMAKDRLHFRTSGSLAAYTAFVRDLDIGIAPLEDTAFNAGRSDVKYLEYAANGTVPVCARAVAYNRCLQDGETGFLFGSTTQLTEVLLRLVDDAPLRHRVAKAAHAHVLSTRTQAQQAPRQLDWLRQLAERAATSACKPGHAADRERPGADAFERLFTGAARGGHPRYRTRPLGTAEQHLYNALVSQGDLDQARRDCAAARKADPDNFLCAMHLARCERSEAAPKHFTEAAALAAAASSEGSTALHFLWAEWAGGQGDTETQVTQLELALRHGPAYAPALLRLGLLREAAGRDGEAEALYRRSLRQNPYYHVTALALATLLARTARTAAAEAVLSEFEAVSDDDPRYWLLRGRIALVDQRSGAAVATLERCLATRGADTKSALPLLAKAYALQGRAEDARAALARLSRT